MASTPKQGGYGEAVACDGETIYVRAPGHMSLEYGSIHGAGLEEEMKVDNK